ncbi:hypothetical protein [Lentilitoribacter sp. EG35]|uniref:hypothetical protein n=1 Tax=Lentilitoribacter sp. EG35 TaxID=3234192 RepID=UPI00345F6977
MTLEKATSWLRFASCVLIGFGILSTVSAHPSLNFLSRPFAQAAIWPFGTVSAAPELETRLIWAIMGGISIGWGVMIWQLATRLLHKETEIIRSILLASTIAWFLTDSAASILSGAGFNAVYNAGFLALFLIPIWRPITSNKASINRAIA